VDSSVTALVTKLLGFKTIGVFMKNWEEDTGECTSEADWLDARTVAGELEIPIYSVNFAKEYREQVFQTFLNEYAQGHTPNPDILCNREIKFQVFLAKAKALGADFLATGHYCQIAHDLQGPTLIKGKDETKDQSYFLYTLKKDILKNVLFPVGHLTKKEVRLIAEKHGLSTAEKKDSTGICFIGERNFKEFLSRYIPYQKGAFITPDGKKVGTHEGMAFYTIGQRKGMGLGGPGEPWFVAAKDAKNNTVTVVQGEKHPALYDHTLTATDLSWVDTAPLELPYFCKAKIRYRQEDQDCVIEKIEKGRLYVRFPVAQRAITPRQSIVFYSGESCLGGAMIEKAGPTLLDKAH
jgi:tRNA-specific 2-thiouridylase